MFVPDRNDTTGRDDVVGRALTALPRVPAPGTLAPRVMAAVARRRDEPWYARSWRTWPVLLRAVVAGAGALVLWAGLGAARTVDEAAGMAFEAVLDSEVVVNAERVASALARAVVVFRAAIDPAYGYVMAATWLAGVSMAVGAALLAGVLWGRRSES